MEVRLRVIDWSARKPCTFIGQPGVALPQCGPRLPGQICHTTYLGRYCVMCILHGHVPGEREQIADAASRSCMHFMEVMDGVIGQNWMPAALAWHGGFMGAHSASIYSNASHVCLIVGQFALQSGYSSVRHFIRLEPLPQIFSPVSSLVFLLETWLSDLSSSANWASMAPAFQPWVSD